MLEGQGRRDSKVDGFSYSSDGRAEGLFYNLAYNKTVRMLVLKP